MTTEIEAVWPRLARRSPIHRKVLDRQDRDVNWFMARPEKHEAVRPAIVEEQIMCMESATEPVTLVRVWLEDVTMKVTNGWMKTPTFRWDAY